jgi:tRNA (adenine57-N1/adenine58-N1)-methyltransferase
MTANSQVSQVFHEGDHALFVDRRGRQYLVRLQAGKTFSSHLGGISHTDVIGKEPGARLETNRGHRLLAVRPTMADFTRLMPRTATVVYPKDLGAILVLGDIFPGARVLEAGSGSGALTIALARAVGERGTVVSYDVRADMLERARANVAAALPGWSNVTFKQGDVGEAIEERDFDRIVLDLPEPWRAVRNAEGALARGGILLSYLPTVLQIHELCTKLRDQGTFDMIETVEILARPWEVGNRSVRPAHRMVAHTGFITTARRCEPKAPGESTDADPNGSLEEEPS